MRQNNPINGEYDILCVMRRKIRTFEVLVALERSLISRMRKLCGIYRAATERGNILLKIMDDGRELTRKYVDDAVKDGVGAFVVGALGVEDAIERIRELSLPLVTISLPCRPGRNVCSVHTDNKAIAKEAVRILSGNRRFASYAYYPANGDPEWSETRGKHFTEIASRLAGRNAARLPHDSLVEKLASLPRPMGLFAANDTYAVELIGACRKAGLSIPSDASVVGVDNEEFLCENATPSLTSIYPDFENEGYTAISMIANMLAGKTVPPKVACGLKESVIRKSAMGERYAESIVNRAMSLINAKATSGLTVSDVCTSLRMSRRLLDMRFRAVKGISPRDAIINRRLDALRKLLKNSDDSIAAICRRCGFGSDNHPKKLFRQRFGITMSDYRRR